MGIKERRAPKDSRFLLLRVTRSVTPAVSVECDDFSAVNASNPFDVVLLVGILCIAHADINLIEGDIGLGAIDHDSAFSLYLVEEPCDIFVGEVLGRIGDTLNEFASILALCLGSIARIADTDEVVVVLIVGRAVDGSKLNVLQSFLLAEEDCSDEIVEVDATLGDVILIHSDLLFE